VAVETKKEPKFGKTKVNPSSSKVRTGKVFYEGNTSAGVPLLFSCINNEPFERDEPWLLEEVFDKLLENGQNPNQSYAMIERKPLIYALENGKYRAFERLLKVPGIDMTQVGNIGCTVLGVCIEKEFPEYTKLVKAKLNESKCPFHNQYFMLREEFKPARACSLIQLWIKDKDKYAEYPIKDEFLKLTEGMKRDIQHTMLRRIWKGKDVSHCKDLYYILKIDLFKTEDKKGNGTFEIILSSRRLGERLDPIKTLDKIHKEYLPDEKYTDDDSLVEAFIQKVGM
jgi:hypothetical protein